MERLVCGSCNNLTGAADLEDYCTFSYWELKKIKGGKKNPTEISSSLGKLFSASFCWI